LISVFAKKYLTQYAYQRLKFEVAKAMKYEIIKEKDTDDFEQFKKQKTWRIRSKGTSNLEAKIYECARIPTPFTEEDNDSNTIEDIKTIVICSSLERINTGLPDAPILTLFLRNVINFNELVFHKRWFKDYESTYKSKLNENLLSQLSLAEHSLSSYCLKYGISDLSSDTTDDHTKDTSDFGSLPPSSIFLPIQKSVESRKELVKAIRLGEQLEISITEEAKEQGISKDNKKKEAKERKPEDIEFEGKVEVQDSGDESMDIDEVPVKEVKEEIKEVVEETSKEITKEATKETIKKSKIVVEKIGEEIENKKEEPKKEESKKEDPMKDDSKKEESKKKDEPKKKDESKKTDHNKDEFKKEKSKIEDEEIKPKDKKHHEKDKKRDKKAEAKNENEASSVEDDTDDDDKKGNKKQKKEIKKVIEKEVKKDKFSKSLAKKKTAVGGMKRKAKKHK
jgi:hypothetical protein